MPNKPNQAMKSVCHHCETPMPESQGRTPKKYCTDTCRKAAQRARAKTSNLPAPISPLPADDDAPAQDAEQSAKSPWRHAGLTPALQLETHLERIERLLDSEEGYNANALAKTWLEGFKLLQTIAPAKAEELDPFERAIQERADRMR